MVRPVVAPNPRQASRRVLHYAPGASLVYVAVVAACILHSKGIPCHVGSHA